MCFCNTNEKELKFLVASSNGFILDFNSGLNFDPIKKRIFDNEISALAVS